MATRRRGLKAAALAAAALGMAGCASLESLLPRPSQTSSEAADASALGIETPVLRRRPVIELVPAPDPARHDLLARLRAGFSLPDGNDERVRDELEWYASHPEYLDRVLGRAQRYLYHITETLEARGMPSDLALLPIVESAYDPFAYSHGRASGLWQIIPGTGRYLGLEQNWWSDERRDVVESTRAALDYLEQLHAQFDGDWLLAVAAYNSGAGHVARALKRAEANGGATDFWSIRGDLPRETRAYVPRLLAIRDLVAAPAERGIELARVPNEPYFETVETGGQIDMALAADLAGIDIESLYALNPGVNRWATDPAGPHRLLVPVEAADALRAGLANLDERGRVEWTRHRIASGETLSTIAARYNTTIDVLREVNGIRGRMIRAGDHLMVPHAREASGTYTQTVSARTARQQNREREGRRHTHVVRRGESLWTIAQRYGVGVRELASWNAMAPGDTLSVGRELVIWGGTAAAGPTTAAAAVPASTSTASPRVRRVNYIVRRGDSLAEIGQRFRVSVDELVEWNGISPDDYLQPGQKLTLYIDVTEQSS